MAHQYFLPEISNVAVGHELVLTGPEAHHAAVVSRLRVGESVRIGNGRGLMTVVTITEVNKSHLSGVIDSVEEQVQESPTLTLIQALAKSDRDERAIEAATELGISSVVPWTASRSISKWVGPKIEKGVSRWQTIVTEASKQSLRSFIPEVAQPHSMKDLVRNFSGHKLIVLDASGEKLLSQVQLDHKNIAIVVGPEGGITADELAGFVQAGAQVCSMGTNILRTSTAGPAALAVLNASLGRS